MSGWHRQKAAYSNLLAGNPESARTTVARKEAGTAGSPLHTRPNGATIATSRKAKGGQRLGRVMRPKKPAQLSSIFSVFEVPSFSSTSMAAASERAMSALMRCSVQCAVCGVRRAVWVYGAVCGAVGGSDRRQDDSSCTRGVNHLFAALPVPPRRWPPAATARRAQRQGRMGSDPSRR